MYSENLNKTTLQTMVEGYILHKYGVNTKSKKIEVAVYSLDQNDIKFRVVKFANDEFKEIHTYEKLEDALKAGEKMIG